MPAAASDQPPPFWSTEAFLRDLLEKENAARLSAETQAAYAAAEAGASDKQDWMAVTDALQRRLLRAAGVPPLQEAAALRCFRAATHTYPALASIPIYRRFQRARAGNLSAGDAAPDVPMLTLTGERTTLLTGTRAARTVAGAAALLPMIIAAGSLS